MTIPPERKVEIRIEAILKENHCRKVPTDRSWDEKRTRKENYIPQYKGKNILAWGEVYNQANYGFNLLLLESNGLYGDWVIMENKNSLSNFTGKIKREPFSFRLQELPEEIELVQMTHLYRAEYKSLDDTSLQKLVKILAYDLE